MVEAAAAQRLDRPRARDPRDAHLDPPGRRRRRAHLLGRRGRPPAHPLTAAVAAPIRATLSDACARLARVVRRRGVACVPAQAVVDRRCTSAAGRAGHDPWRRPRRASARRRGPSQCVRSETHRSKASLGSSGLSTSPVGQALRDRLGLRSGRVGSRLVGEARCGRLVGQPSAATRQPAGRARSVGFGGGPSVGPARWPPAVGTAGVGGSPVVVPGGASWSASAGGGGRGGGGRWPPVACHRRRAERERRSTSCRSGTELKSPAR